MPNVTLGTCPLSLEPITSQNFDQTRLVIVGNTIYPIIGEEYWNSFVLKVHQCPFTRSKNYRVLMIADLPENLKNHLISWLITDVAIENAPHSPKALAELLTSNSDTAHPESLNGMFLQYLTDRHFTPQAVAQQAMPAPQIAIDIIIQLLLNGTISAVQYNQLNTDIRQIIVDNAAQTRNLISINGLSFENIQLMGADNFRELVEHPTSIRTLRQQYQVTFNQLINLDIDNLRILTSSPHSERSSELRNQFHETLTYSPRMF